MNKNIFVIKLKVKIMENYDNSNSKNEQHILKSILENCDENSYFCTDWCCYIKCNGKWYRIEYFDPLGTMDDEYIEIFEDEPPNIDS